MELIVISESKLKIMLTAPDMAHYELENTRMDCADAHTRAAFRHIFDDARNRIGFDTQGERLCVQLYASKEGGCEIFVTKLGGGEETFPVFDLTESLQGCDTDPSASSPLAVTVGGLSEGEMNLLRRICEDGEEDGMEPKHKEIPRAGAASAHTRKVVMAFDDMENLLTVCRRLLRDGYRRRSSVYITESEGRTDWYLLLEVPDVTLYRLPLHYSFLTEYGRDVTESGSTAYLAEYGRLICEGDGVKRMGQF